MRNNRKFQRAAACIIVWAVAVTAISAEMMFGSNLKGFALMALVSFIMVAENFMREEFYLGVMLMNAIWFISLPTVAVALFLDAIHDLKTRPARRRYDRSG